MTVITLTKENFKEEVLFSPVPVLLDFYADWCAPCRMQATEVDKFAEKYGGEIKVGKINIDQEEFLAQLYDVTAVPTLISMENGDIIEKSVGLIPHHMIDQLFVKK